MNRSDLPDAVRRFGTTAAYALLGAVGTALVALATLALTRGVQAPVYRAVYLRVGPSEATETAVLAHFLAVAVLSLALPTLAGDYLSDGLAHWRALGAGVAATAGLLAVFLLGSLVGWVAVPTALALLAAFLVVPAVLYWRGVRSGGLAAFTGGIPVVALLLLLAGFGLGWGWGYVVTAEEVPDGDPAATFESAVAFERDLFAAANCETDADGSRVCRLQLRGYEHERAAARFMANHGVRCPYGNARSTSGDGSFLASHDGATFRVSCSSHGD